MAGPNRLHCGGFTETEGFDRSLEILRAELAARGESISDEQIDDRLGAILWSLAHGDEGDIAEQLPGLRTWVAVLPGVYPFLRFFLTPREDVPDECCLLWVEERL